MDEVGLAVGKEALALRGCPAPQQPVLVQRLYWCEEVIHRGNSDGVCCHSWTADGDAQFLVAWTRGQAVGYRSTVLHKLVLEQHYPDSPSPVSN